MKKLLLSLLVSIGALVFDTAMAQSTSQPNPDQRISISASDTPLRTVLGKIEQETGFLFVYNRQAINSDQPITFRASNMPLKEVLSGVFSGKQVSYRLEGGNIVLFAQQERPAVAEAATSSNLMLVSGTVKDSQGEPVVGARVHCQQTKTTVATDVLGVFGIRVPVDAVLHVSFIGYVAQEVVVGKQTQIAVVLAEDVQHVDEVVVVGYGTQKKTNLTGAVSQVNMEKVLGDRPVTSLGTALQGAMPGLTASTSAQPGGGNTFNIRGFTSITGGTPLILVDNVVYNDLYLLNPADIESVSVLKDAASAAIYGARAAFGVVLITTKKAKKNETLTINYNNNFAFKTTTGLPELASPSDFLQTLKNGGYASIWSGQNVDSYLTLLDQYRADPSLYPLGWTESQGVKYFLRQTDVYGDMFETGFQQIHNVSAQGGGERVQYRIALGYTSDDGVLVTDKDDFKRFNVTSYVSGNITKWLSTSLNVDYSNGIKRYPYVDPSSELGIWKSNLPSYHPVGSLPYGSGGDALSYPVMTPSNIIELAQADKTITDNTRILSRTVINPVEGLKGVLEIGYQMGLTDYESYANLFKVHQGLAESIKPSTAKTPFTSSKAITKYTTLNAFVTYDKAFGKKKNHNFSVLGGYNQEYSDYRYQYSQVYNMISNELPSLSTSDGSTPPKTSDAYNQYALRSAFFRATYNYDQRYFIELNGRYDLSSKFPQGYRGGFFPSVSGAWNLAREQFMAPASNVISLLKIRGSYGELGNQNVDNYGYYAMMDVIAANWINGGLVPKTLNAPGMVRANYSWEKVITANLGLDFALFNNQLNGTVEVYQRDTKGMLGPGEELPSVAGATAPKQNAADLRTRGWEVSLSWRGQIGKDWNYSIGANVFDSRSVITRYKNETKTLSADYYEGQEIGEIWGYVANGFYTADDFDATGKLKEGVVSINGYTVQEGDIKFLNLNDEDGKNEINTGDNTATNPGDRRIIGNSRPRYQFGVNGSIEWKGLSLSFMMQGAGERQTWIGGAITFPMPDQYSTVYTHQVGRVWTPDNIEHAFYGRLRPNATGSQASNQRVSDKFLYSSWYVRFKNITLAYALPESALRKIYLKGVKVFLSAENPFTFCDLPKGIDPESLSWGYPYARTISFGVNITL